MNILISWSGPRSRAVATKFKDWIEDILQLADPWMSEEDIPSGRVWFESLDNELEDAQYGIVCVTRNNQTAPWLLWEAGALFGGFKDGRRRDVVPLLIDLGKNDLIEPLDKFQAIRATNKKEMLKMLGWINRDLHKSIARNRLEEQLDRCWDDWNVAVDDAIKNIPDLQATGGSSPHTFKQAAERFLLENKIREYEYRLRWPREYIDSLPLEQVTDQSLAQYLEERRAGTSRLPDGMKDKGPPAPATVSKEVQLVTMVLRSAKKWHWIEHIPSITQLPQDISRKQYVLTWDEQDRLIKALPDFAKPVALFSVNTGASKGIIRKLQWSWLETVPGLDIPIFRLPEDIDRRNAGRTIVLNSVAKQVVKGQREVGHERYVFPGRQGGMINLGRPFGKAWKKARLPVKGGHALGISNLYWTFQKRLEDAGVGLEDREFLLWKGDSLRKRGDRPPNYVRLLEYLEKITTRPGNGGISL